MMAYRWLTDLDAALRNAGLPYHEVGPSSLDPTGATSWRTRGRPSSTGAYDPAGILCHHTASPAGTSDQAEINAILAGNSEAPGPIAPLFCGRSGELYLIAAGRCNHGGKGRRPGIDTGGCADMNALLIGIEAGNSGVGEPWPAAQTDAYAALVAALADHYGFPVGAVYLHATTGPPSGGCNSKIDPAGPWELEPNLVGSTTWNLGTWRTYVADHWPGSANLPDNLPDNGDEMTDADWTRLTQIVHDETNKVATAWVRSPEFQSIIKAQADAACNRVATSWVRSPEFSNTITAACRDAMA